MAKTAKYTEEKLLEAVVKYAEQYRGKIEATKLAKWASVNIPGLEGVEDRHFMRPTEKRDPQSGKVTRQTKLCTEKIKELNAARSVAVGMNSNPLLKSANVEKFLELPTHEQRRLILETRRQVDKLVAENIYLQRENKAIKTRSDAIETQVLALSKVLEDLKKDQGQLLTIVTRAMAVFDEGERRKMLESIGVCDGYYDLDTYVKSLTVQISDAFSLNDVIKNHRTKSAASDIDKLIDGIDF